MLSITLHTCETEAEAESISDHFGSSDGITIIQARVRGAEELIMVCGIYGDDDDGIGWAAIDLLQHALKLHNEAETMQ